MPGLQVLDAVQNGTVECGHTYSGYYVGKNPALIFDGSLPFGLTPRQHNAWYLFGDGKKLIDELYDGFGVVSIPMGNTGGQTFGWFRKEIKSPADFNGVKMRVAGFGGRVLAKLGVVPQQIAGGDIYPALEKGTLDAAEWVGPHDDEKLGFHKVAKYMHIPGVLETGGEQLASTSTRRRGRRCRRAIRRSLRGGVFLRADGDARQIRRAEREGDQPRGGGGRADRRADAGDLARAAQRARAGARRGSRPRARSSRRSRTTGARSAPNSTAGSRSPTPAPRCRSMR